jgi:hypothetical protein
LMVESVVLAVEPIAQRTNADLLLALLKPN